MLERFLLYLNQFFSPPSDFPMDGSLESYQEWQYKRAEFLYNSFYQHFVNFQGKKILDLGCGVGGKVIFYAEKIPSSSYVGVDIDGASLKYAKLLAQKRGVKNLQFKKCEENSLPFPSSFFDIVICEETLEHVENPLAVLKEVKRVLKPGGYFLCIIGPLYYSKNGHHLFPYINIPWVHLLFPTKTIKEAIKYMPPWGHILFPEKVIETFLTLNRWNYEKYKRAFYSLKMEKIYFAMHRTNEWCFHLPLIRNLFIDRIRCIFQKVNYE